MKMSKPNCPKCNSFRELTLHLHELSLFCRLLNDEKPVYKIIKRSVVESGSAKTTSIAKWLSLASQLEQVTMNTFRYEEAHIYCEPVSDELNSDAQHYSSLATSITRFIFISNALEETYRLTSQAYEESYSTASKQGKKIERQRSYSTQAAWLLDEKFDAASLPKHYLHKVNALLELASAYRDEFDASFDLDLLKSSRNSMGLAIVRNLRNHIAHATFPIIENPEFNWDYDDPKVKKLILALLLRASRVATMNIQILLSSVCDTFKSDEYNYFSEDPDTGGKFKEIFSLKHLENLHINQDFGLNESSYWAWRYDSLED